MTKLAFKITKLTKGIKVGERVPKQNGGNVGYVIERRLANNGYVMNPGAGPDIEKFITEVKTRKLGAQSANTVGSMTLDNIKTTPYEDSNVCAKMQRQYRVHYNDTFHEVTSEQIFDFTSPHIQRKIELGYESARKLIIGGCTHDYINGGEGIGYFERKRIGDDKTSYDFRIPGSQMKKLESMANTTKQFDRLFEIG